ncbi:MAG: glycerophosphodiester phosphodiesterase [Microthrixaceae bacterium]
MSKREDVLIIAHRGASAECPENTVEAFAEAGKQRSDWVELDVRAARDGTLIVHHDAWYHDGRTVWATPSDERPESVPDLETALDACLVSAGMGVNVEIKNLPDDLGGDDVPWSLEVVDATCDLLESRRAAGVGQQILLTSFDRDSLDRVRTLDGPPSGQLVFDVPAWPEVFESCVERGHVAVNPWDPFVDEAFVEAAHSAGLEVNVWTVDEYQRVRDLAAMGVDGIITNVPAAARKALLGG